MNTQRLLAFLGIGVIGFMAIKQAGKSLLDQLDFRIRATGLRPSFDRATVDLDVTFKNNSQVPINVRGFAGHLDLSNQILSALTVSNPVTVNAGETKVIPAQASIVYQTISQNIIALITSGNFLPSLRVVGRLNLDELSFNVNKNIISVG